MPTIIDIHGNTSAPVTLYALPTGEKYLHFGSVADRVLCGPGCLGMKAGLVLEASADGGGHADH